MDRTSSTTHPEVPVAGQLQFHGLSQNHVFVAGSAPALPYFDALNILLYVTY